MIILFYCFLIVNVIAFVLIAYDKYLAKNQKKRIPEKTLLTFVLIGGTIGSALAMLIFRHKTAKRSYLLKFWALLVMQVVFLFAYFYFGFYS
ncbi:DUF1294 domain-containing protein [Flavobacterium frigoris]|uniref:Uncharacterized membrane protein YsdA, DUF1294 family n=1 Tax=Flavobacterium frigoris TaxID=229204 RepID=A0A1H9CMW8_FLAFI|nr:DUF1294 domain-containing protein [Flavobacterium frigoris]SEQ02397.1 Uncharacterized membrane protein YsdA, DUF1294 family [Flavobacterium frigoris]